MIDLNPSPTKVMYLDHSRPVLLARRSWRLALITLIIVGMTAGFVWSTGLPAKAEAGGLSANGARSLIIDRKSVV